ncbi:MAG: FtsX-like permease family protein, partial [Chloroflexota bacterium]
FGGEALVIGLIGGILGTALGAAASEIITTAIANAVAVQVSVALDAGTLLGGIALGIVATLIFAVLPIARSASLRPLEILRHGGEARIAGRAPQTAALLGVVVILFAALASAVLGDWVLAAEFVIGAFIACAIMTGAFSLLVGWTGLLGRPPNAAFGLLILVLLLVGLTYSLRVQPAFSIILGLAALVWASTVLLPDARLLPLRIAARSLSRRRARTSVTLVAFLVGILCMTLTLTVALTLQSQISGALASANSVNMVAIGNAATANAMLHASSHLPGVRSRSAVTTLQARPTSVNGRALTSILGSAPSVSPDDAIRMLDGVTGWDLKHGHLPTSVYVTAGRDLSRRDAGTDNVLVNQELRFAPYRIAPGSTIILRDSTSGVSRQVTVVGLYSRAHGIRRRSIGSFFTQPVFGDRSLTNVLGPTDAQTIASFNVQSAQLTGDTARLQRLVPGALVINVNDLTAVVRSILNDLLNVLVVITGLAMGAGLAVVGTSVSLAMLERYREIALYKVIGFSPRSVLSFVLVENALAGTLAGGVSVGLVAAALAILSRTALQTTISFDPILAIYVVAGAMLLAIVTAYLLARGSVNVRPLDALRNE